MGNAHGMTRPTAGCCFYTYSSTPGVYSPEPRFESMLHGMLGGWVSCLHLTEFARRALILWQRRKGLWGRVAAQSVADVSLCFSLIPALVNGLFFGVSMLSSADSWATQELWYVNSGAWNWGYVLIFSASGFTSAQAVKISRLYAALKDASRLRVNTRMKTMERITYTWAFLSPLCYLCLFLLLLHPGADGQLYFFFSALFLFETTMGFCLCLFVLPMINRAQASSNDAVWWLWWTCAGAEVVGLAQFALDGYQTVVAAEPIPAYWWDLIELARGYYLFNLMVPTARLTQEHAAVGAAAAEE